MLVRPPPADWIVAHRRVWARKPGLRRVYERWFALVRHACDTGAPIVEIGCGPGWLKARYPEVVATDGVANPYADARVDAGTLPFRDAQVGSFVMIDVFHHLPVPSQFLREVARALRPGGRLVMVEPWLGIAGRVLYRYLHHEDCDAGVDPLHPWDTPDKDAMRGNAALPSLYFQAGGQLERLGLPLRITRRTPFAGMPWVLSGGFQPVGLLPGRLEPAVEAVDRMLSRVPWLTATRCLVVIERTTGACPAA